MKIQIAGDEALVSGIPYTPEGRALSARLAAALEATHPTAPNALRAANAWTTEDRINEACGRLAEIAAFLAGGSDVERELAERVLKLAAALDEVGDEAITAAVLS
jgi:hypothetical protein